MIVFKRYEQFEITDCKAYREDGEFYFRNRKENKEETLEATNIR